MSAAKLCRWGPRQQLLQLAVRRLPAIEENIWNSASIKPNVFLAENIDSRTYSIVGDARYKPSRPEPTKMGVILVDDRASDSMPFVTLACGRKECAV